MRLVILMFLLSSFCYAQRKVIVVVDSGLPTAIPKEAVCGSEDLTGTGITDTLGHGSLVTALILNQINIKCFCIVMIKWCDSTFCSGTNILMSLVRAVAYKPAYLNLSLGGPGPARLEGALLQYLQRQGTKIFVAAGNSNSNLERNCNVFPACHTNVKMNVVGSLTPKFKQSSFTNYGMKGMLWFVGEYGKHMGTSFASPTALGYYASQEGCYE